MSSVIEVSLFFCTSFPRRFPLCLSLSPAPLDLRSHAISKCKSAPSACARVQANSNGAVRKSQSPLPRALRARNSRLTVLQLDSSLIRPLLRASLSTSHLPVGPAVPTWLLSTPIRSSITRVHHSCHRSVACCCRRRRRRTRTHPSRGLLRRCLVRLRKQSTECSWVEAH